MNLAMPFLELQPERQQGQVKALTGRLDKSRKITFKTDDPSPVRQKIFWIPPDRLSAPL
jgi:hypothetical protein